MMNPDDVATALCGVTVAIRFRVLGLEALVDSYAKLLGWDTQLGIQLLRFLEGLLSL